MLSTNFAGRAGSPPPTSSDEAYPAPPVVSQAKGREAAELVIERTALTLVEDQSVGADREPDSDGSENVDCGFAGAGFVAADPGDV